MRRIISLFLTVLMIVSMCTFVSFGASAEEVAIPAEPALETLADTTGYTALSSAKDFSGKKAVLTDPAGKYYLTADVTLDATIALDFSGEFHGNGHTLTISAPLFQSLNGATISNLKIAGSISDGSGGHVGALAKTAAEDSTVTLYKVINDADVVNTADGSCAAAGFIPEVLGNIVMTNCYNSGDIQCVGGGNYAAAGFVSYVVGTTEATNCVNTGTITSTARRAAGIVGTVDHSATFVDCVNAGAITSAEFAAGILCIGITDDATNHEFLIENCHNTASVTTKGASYAAGIVGRFKQNKTAAIIGCTNSGDIKLDNADASSAHSAAGIIAVADSHVVIDDCSNSATIESVARQAGGIMGHANVGGFTITNCENTGAINAAGSGAGIVANSSTSADADRSIKNCVNSGAVTAGDYAAGIVAYFHQSKTMLIEKCVNKADISGNGSSGTGGIVAYMNTVGGAGTADAWIYQSIISCFNSGNVTGKRGTVGGIVGSTTGSGGSFKGPQVIYCGSVGTITNTLASGTKNTGYANGIIGYANVTILDMHDNFFAGTVVSTSGKTLPIAAIGQTTLKDGTTVAAQIAKNYVVTANDTDIIGHVNCDKVTDEVPVTTVTAADMAAEYKLTADDVTSGKLAYLMQEATGEDETIWGQTLSGDKVDANPVLFGEKVVPFRTVYINAYITDRALSLAESFNYKVYAKISVKTKFMQMVVTLNGVTTEIAAEPTEEEDIYVFSFDGVAPQFIASDITTELVLADTVDSKTASILDYCESLYETTEDAELKTLVEKVFLYGAAARDYVVAKELYTAEALPAVTSDVIKASAGTVPAFNGSVVTTTGVGARFVSANVFFDSTNKIVANFTLEDGVTAANVTVNGQAIGEPDANGVYTYTTDAQYAKYYGTPETIVLAVGGEPVATLEYSVNIYAQRIANSANASEAMKALATATYEYGAAAVAYAN